MNNLYESQFYDLSFRGTSHDLSSVKVFTNKNSFSIEKQISFDSEYEPISSIEYFAGSMLSSILLALLEQSKRRGSIIDEIEGVLSLTLANPLHMLEVRGYDEASFIKNITATIYISSDLEDDELNQFCDNALSKSPIYNSLKRTMKFDICIKKLLA